MKKLFKAMGISLLSMSFQFLAAHINFESILGLALAKLPSAIWTFDQNFTIFISLPYKLDNSYYHNYEITKDVFQIRVVDYFDVCISFPGVAPMVHAAKSLAVNMGRSENADEWRAKNNLVSYFDLIII